MISISTAASTCSAAAASCMCRNMGVRTPHISPRATSGASA